jgi:hypothetical protein
MSLDMVPDFYCTIFRICFELCSFVNGLIEEIAAVIYLPSDPFHLG